MNIPLRVIAVIICCLVGFVFPPTFLVAVVLVFSIISDIINPIVAAPTHRDKLKTLSPSEDRWLDSFHKICESPAEITFLDAMIFAFNLKPENGLLVGSGLKLQMQVPVSRYRLDFLVDKNLIVEIDGAAYHSSPEAVLRDRTRDAFLTGEGFKTLRIPAKIALYDPTETVSRVRNARKLAAENRAKKVQEIKESFRPAKVLASVNGALASFSEGIKKFNEEIDRANKANDEASVQQTAAELKRIQDEIDAVPGRRELFEEVRMRFGLVENQQNNATSSKAPEKSAVFSSLYECVKDGANIGQSFTIYGFDPARSRHNYSDDTPRRNPILEDHQVITLVEVPVSDDVRKTIRFSIAETGETWRGRNLARMLLVEPIHLENALESGPIGKTGAAAVIKYDKNGRAYASASFDRESLPASFLSSLRPNPVLVAELVAELMLDVPESFYDQMDEFEADFNRNRLKDRCEESIGRTWRRGICREDLKALAAKDFEEAYRPDYGWGNENEERFW